MKRRIPGFVPGLQLARSGHCCLTLGVIPRPEVRRSCWAPVLAKGLHRGSPAAAPQWGHSCFCGGVACCPPCLRRPLPELEKADFRAAVALTICPCGLDAFPSMCVISLSAFLALSSLEFILLSNYLSTV